MVLFRGLLKDPATERIGRRGQSQHGVDIYGLRNEDPTRPVGIQCKAKGLGKQLTEAEVRKEVGLALGFEPSLKEYFIVTTAPDDAEMQRLARVITAEQHAKGEPLRVTIWGWGNLEERIAQDPEAIAAFDPGHTTHTALLLEETIALRAEQNTNFRVTGASLDRIETLVTRISMVAPGDATSPGNALDAVLDAQIDRLRDMSNDGKPTAAYGLLAAMLTDVIEQASGRIIFRIKANMGSCLFEMGDNERAGTMLIEASEHALEEPKALANKAFGLLLLARYSELFEFGRSVLERQPDNSGLASYLVQGLRASGSNQDPVSILPAGVLDKEDVVVALVDHRRTMDPATWQSAAADASARFPDNPILRRFKAEASMERVINSDAYQRTLKLTEADRQALSDAIAVLTSLWEERIRADVPLKPGDGAICANLILAHYALDEYPSALALARRGHGLLPDDEDIIVRGMLVALEGDDTELADLLFPLLGDTAQTPVLKLRYHHERKDWKAVAALVDLPVELVPDVERHMLQTMVALANLRLRSVEDRAAEITKLVDGAVDHPRSSIAIAAYALGEGLEEPAETAYLNAFALIDADSHVAARVTVAVHAARIGKWADVAKTLRGQVDTASDSMELRMLANAMVNDTPVKRGAVRFFAELPAPVRDMPYYLRAAGMMHFNRGALQEAERALRAAVAVAPVPEAYTALFATLRRAGKEAEIAPLLAGIDFANVEGQPVDLMRLAHELSAVGRDADAVALAYRTVVANRNEPQVAMAYFGLLIGNSREMAIPVVDRVTVDAWVRVEDQDGKSLDCIVTLDDNRPADGFMSLVHPMVAAGLGLQVGANFVLDGPLGVEKTYRVVEIKHKYLHALHDVMNNFETRFPSERGLQSFTMKDGDLEPFLDQVKRLSEENDRRLELHTVQGAPLSMVAAFTKDSVIGLADHLRRLGHDLRTSSGNLGERMAAIRMIRDRRAGGVSLDTFALWTAATMECLDMVRDVFGEIVIARSVVDDLIELREREFGEGERLSVGYHAGEHFRTIVSAEEMANRRLTFDALLEQIESHCRIVPVEAPDDVGELAAALLTTFGSHVLDPAFVTGGERLLISEDRHYREYSSAATGISGVWLQAVSEFALRSGLIAMERHVRHTISFARRRHGYVTFDAQTLMDTIAKGDREGAAALCRYLGDPTAHMPSHLNLVATVLGWLWRSTDAPPKHAGWATGLMLEALARHQPNAWLSVLAWIHHVANSDLADYLDRWTVGHFYDPALVASALATLRGRRAAARVAALQSRTPFTLVSRDWPIRV
ncbi:MAG: hypothetical protein ABS76_38455 [Pelagibacterium sp. SCN 64-44]|nr:MAG: hypothetical protein ABS76_38455 [Pelagibacterium sp. SCN 64-44]